MFGRGVAIGLIFAACAVEPLAGDRFTPLSAEGVSGHARCGVRADRVVWDLSATSSAALANGVTEAWAHITRRGKKGDTVRLRLFREPGLFHWRGEWGEHGTELDCLGEQYEVHFTLVRDGDSVKSEPILPVVHRP